MPYKDPEKRKEYAKNHYINNRDAYVARRTQQQRVLRQRVNELKESMPCVDCGEYYSYWIMQYDHTGSDKVASIADLVRGKSWPHVEKEIAKCDLVCANCHATRTHNRRMKQHALAPETVRD